MEATDPFFSYLLKIRNFYEPQILSKVLFMLNKIFNIADRLIMLNSTDPERLKELVTCLLIGPSL